MITSTERVLSYKSLHNLRRLDRSDQYFSYYAKILYIKTGEMPTEQNAQRGKRGQRSCCCNQIYSCIFVLMIIRIGSREIILVDVSELGRFSFLKYGSSCYFFCFCYHAPQLQHLHQPRCSAGARLFHSSSCFRPLLSSFYPMRGHQPS